MDSTPGYELGNEGSIPSGSTKTNTMETTKNIFWIIAVFTTVLFEVSWNNANAMIGFTLAVVGAMLIAFVRENRNESLRNNVQT